MEEICMNIHSKGKNTKNPIFIYAWDYGKLTSDRICFTTTFTGMSKITKQLDISRTNKIQMQDEWFTR